MWSSPNILVMLFITVLGLPHFLWVIFEDFPGFYKPFLEKFCNRCSDLTDVKGSVLGSKEILARPRKARMEDINLKRMKSALKQIRGRNSEKCNILDSKD